MLDRPNDQNTVGNGGHSTRIHTSRCFVIKSYKDTCIPPQPANTSHQDTTPMVESHNNMHQMDIEWVEDVEVEKYMSNIKTTPTHKNTSEVVEELVEKEIVVAEEPQDIRKEMFYDLVDLGDTEKWDHMMIVDTDVEQEPKVTRCTWKPPQPANTVLLSLSTIIIGYFR